jgi:IS1 family transposase
VAVVLGRAACLETSFSSSNRVNHVIFHNQVLNLRLVKIAKLGFVRIPVNIAILDDAKSKQELYSILHCFDLRFRHGSDGRKLARERQYVIRKGVHLKFGKFTVIRNFVPLGGMCRSSNIAYSAGFNLCRSLPDVHKFGRELMGNWENVNQIIWDWGVFLAQWEKLQRFNVWRHLYPSALRIDDSLSVKQRGVRTLICGPNSVFRGDNVFLEQPSLFGYSQKSQENSPSCRPVGPSEEAIPTWQVPYGIGLILLGMIGIRYSSDDRATRLLAFLCGLLGGMFILNGYVDCQAKNEDESKHIFQHSGQIVTQKYLTGCHYCNTVIDMANVLNTDKQTTVIGALAEGSSIRSIERITGIHRDTIMRLGVKVGQGCATLLDAKMRDLPCQRLEFDEVWGFIGKKQKHVRVDDDEQFGDVWTFCAIDAETKLVPSFKCGKRDLVTAKAFVGDVASRMRNRVQISSDALRAYVDAIEQTFGTEVDFAQIVKTYEHDESQHPARKYSAPEFVSVEKRAVTGRPDMDLVSTSYIERLNATTRLHMRRLTRLTLAFSKKLENFEAAVALHFAYYNLVKRHGTLRCTPAMAAGIERDFWSVGDLVEAS